ncbi:Mur ligase family protein [Candidatus Saccharibacteria bacterium]|nr:Mur ligase family protein [Candidatus Saccharibacteria bacterium]
MGLLSNPTRQLEKYFSRHPNVKTIVVAGSFGRTSAFRALGQILGQAYTVTMGVNRNIPDIPDIVLLDFNSVSNFPNITPDFTVITSVAQSQSAGQTSEAKAYFDLANRSRHVLINREDVPSEYVKFLTNSNITTYGDELPANFYFENLDENLHGQTGNFVNPEGQRIHVHVNLLGGHNLRPVAMAVAIAHFFEVPPEKIIAGVESLHPLPGHMSVGRGTNGSIIIDDSADTSVLSTQLSLRTIYALDAPSRILITGPFDPAITIDKNLISEVIIIDPKAPPQPDPIFKIFATQLDALEYLATRLEPDGIVLLEYHLPDITISKIL